MLKIILLVLVVALSGCASSLTKLDPDTISRIDSGNALAEARCWEAQKAANSIDCTGLSEMGCLMLKQQQSTVQLLAVATGRNPSPCGNKKGLADVLIAEVQAKNETARSVTSSFIDLGKWGVGAWAATKVADAAFGAAGSKTSVSNSDDAYVDASQTSTVTHTSTTGIATGEGTVNPATTPAPVVVPVTTTTPVATE